MPNTPVLGLPYPLSTDTADVPRDLQALAVKLDTVVPAAAGSVAVVSGQVSDVGQIGQMRAGRQLSALDFTSLGLSAPRGLWNLSDLTDASGNGRNLTSKGGVPFGVGINGAAATAAQFNGSTGQALYIADTGAADPFRIATGSWGCWFRTAKRGTTQAVMSRRGAAAGSYAWELYAGTGNNLNAWVSVDGSTLIQAGFAGVSDVCDDRWHFAVVTIDGASGRLYVDGVLEVAPAVGGTIFAAAAPLNIGAAAADGATAATEPHFGRVDEAFVTADVLSEDQVRALYAARLTHTLGATPKTVSLSVRRARKGAALISGDFSTTPLRLHNFTAGVLTDQGSGNVPLTVAAGTPVSVAGADGTLGSGYSFNGAASLGATDTGLPSALLARSYGCWLKTATASGVNAMAWGTVSTGDARMLVDVNGLMNAWSAGDAITGSYVRDGQWHHVVVTEDNAAADGVKRKLYVDGRVVGVSTVLNAIALAGANGFRVGANATGGGPFTGQVDAAFVAGYAMASDEVLRLYAKGAQPLLASPKNAGDHVEGFDSGSLLFIGDALESQHSFDLTVS
jgi:hypothetical protein